MTNILGISAFYHDSAASLIIDGEIVNAVQEERFTRIKHDASFPSNSINWCLKDRDINFSDLDYIVFYDKPFLKFERLIETYLGHSPSGFKSFSKSIPIWIKQKLFLKNYLNREFLKLDSNFNLNKLKFCEHHLSHAASAFYPSPFKSAAILTMDGVGEWATTSIGLGYDDKIEIIREINYPHSLGLLYSAFTQFLGFKVNSGEYKVMGLAPYGKPIYKSKIMDNLIDLKDDGSFRLNQKFFDYSTGLSMINKSFIELFNFETRKENQEITIDHMNVAASIQRVTEEVVLKISKEIKKITGEKNLCLAGGVALNCVANSKIKSLKLFDDIWVQPASGDAGGSIGSALAINYLHLKNKRKVLKQDSMKGAYLGPRWDIKEIENKLRSINCEFKYLEMKELIKKSAYLLSEGNIIGFFQGKMEFGPRALGNRSILADPRRKNMQKDLNLKIKFRESFRPFAPSILEEDLADWFNTKTKDPYMTFTSNVIKQDYSREILDNNALSVIPSVTHVDGSSRIQTVKKETNKMFYELLKEFKKITDCPILINTSFNVRGEPIVNTPEDAFKCFMGTGLDYLVIENFLIDKKSQINKNFFNHKNEFLKD